MNKKLFILCLPVLLLFMSCQNQQKHFITDETYRTQVENDFQAREGSLEKSGLLAIFDQPMSPAEKEALSFSKKRFPRSLLISTAPFRNKTLPPTQAGRN